MSIFTALDIYHDETSRSAALNMAIDEALLEVATVPSIRFYQWDHPAISFGYFGKFDDVAAHLNGRDIVRRWTGGGIVFHGQDLTYSVVIPNSDRAFAESSISIYEKIHRALCAALAANGQSVELAAAPMPKISESCFANPVRADVLLNGFKVAGAAQRRTRLGLLQQGSIQNVDFGNGFADLFAKNLSAEYRRERLAAALLTRAEEIGLQKYATTAWLRRR
jgi:lipoate-protein ligase A